MDPGAQPFQKEGVVAYNDQPQLTPLGFSQEKVPDLGLGDEIQHGGDLIAQEVAHPVPQGPGDAEALKLPPGELQGIALQPGGLDVQGVQQAVFYRTGLIEGLPQAQEGVYRRLRVLPDHLYRAEAPVGGERAAVQQDLPPVGPLIAG